MKEIERRDFDDENTEVNSMESYIRMSLKAELLSLYQMDERTLVQKSKLNWLNLGDETLCSSTIS